MRTVEKTDTKSFLFTKYVSRGRKSLPKKDVEQVMKYFFIKRCGKRKNV